MRHVVSVGILGLAALFAVSMAALGSDPDFRAHAWVLALCLGLAVIIVLRTIRFGVAKRAAGTREFASTQRL